MASDVDNINLILAAFIFSYRKQQQQQQQQNTISWSLCYICVQLYTNKMILWFLIADFCLLATIYEGEGGDYTRR